MSETPSDPEMTMADARDERIESKAWPAERYAREWAAFKAWIAREWPNDVTSPAAWAVWQGRADFGDAALHQPSAPTVPADLVELSRKATEGPWFDHLEHAIGANEEHGAYEHIMMTPAPRSPIHGARHKSWTNDKRLVVRTVNWLRALISTTAQSGTGACTHPDRDDSYENVCRHDATALGFARRAMAEVGRKRDDAQTTASIQILFNEALRTNFPGPATPAVTDTGGVGDVERSMSSEAVLGFKVAAYRETHPEHGSRYGHRYSEHWSTPNSRNPAVKVERLFTESQLRQAIASRDGCPAGVRPEIATFALLMERELRANDHKPGWKNDRPDELAKRVMQEADELREVILDTDKMLADRQRNSVIASEAADVANMAMMVADVCGCLETPPPADKAGVVAGARDVVLEEAADAAGSAAWLHLGDDAYSQGLDKGARDQVKACVNAIRALKSTQPQGDAREL